MMDRNVDRRAIYNGLVDRKRKSATAKREAELVAQVERLTKERGGLVNALKAALPILLTAATGIPRLAERIQLVEAALAEAEVNHD